MTKVIGAFVVALLVMILPILTTLAYVYDYHDFVKYILIVGMIAEVVALTCAIFGEAGEKE